MTTPERQQAYITLVRTYATQLWLAYQGLLSLQAEWNAQDYGTNLENGAGVNQGISNAMVGAAIFATPNAMTTLFASGHATNLTAVLLPS